MPYFVDVDDKGPKKHFRMVRRYGLYRRDINKLAQSIVNGFPHGYMILINFAWDDEPGVMPETICPECGGEMAHTGETEDRDKP